MPEWLVLLLGLFGVDPSAQDRQSEMTTALAIELEVPEMAGAERRFIRFNDSESGSDVLRMTMHGDAGFVIVDYRQGLGASMPNGRSASGAATIGVAVDDVGVRQTSGWYGQTAWRFFALEAKELDCIALNRPVQTHHEVGNFAEVVDSEVLAVLCLRTGMLAERDVWRVAQALHVNDPAATQAARALKVKPGRYRIAPLNPG